MPGTCIAYGLVFFPRRLLDSPLDHDGADFSIPCLQDGDDYGKETMHRDECRLAELGRRTVEVFIVANIFGELEVGWACHGRLHCVCTAVRHRWPEEDLKQYKQGAIWLILGEVANKSWDWYKCMQLVYWWSLSLL